MNLTGFTDEQKRALVDLLVLGMYADGNLDLIEDEKARRVLDAIQFPSDSDRQYFLDASFARARKNNASPEAVRVFVVEIAKIIPSPAMRREVYNVLEDSLSSDNQIAETETRLLTIITEEFDL
jgi:uncharacterized tellurite resistance protein B-like protein